ncbi:hypothetical protein [Planococcus shixiaomingii]|uniref:hypothetical protein n=1 Tax=Planococcus shixiaomingii TaxID=3058393 RepID=UPI00262A3CE3|nr:hypothetical protein [Planococcus sp. N022]WKA54470.1 hypothetical protein QWY21_17630 [Planococcus sp. N022]
MKKFMLLFFCLVFFTAGCEEAVSKEPPTAKKAEAQEVESAEKEVFMKNVTANPVDLDIVSQAVDLVSCGGSETMIAPSFVTDEFIYFNGHDGERGVSWIKEMSRKSGECEQIYEGEGIGNLTGYGENLYFSSYDITKGSNVEWEIRELDLKTRNVSVVTKGSSMNDTQPPAVEATDAGISWIEYETAGTTVTSKLFEMYGSTKEAELKKTGTLDESGERNGGFFALQQGSGPEGILLYKSVFKDGQKEMDISLVKEGDKSRSLLEEDGILGFAASTEHFAYTATGYFKAQNLEKTEPTWIYRVDPQLTFDAPVFLDEDLVIFRYSMNQLFLADLAKGEVYPLTGFEKLVSKPVMHNGLVSYAYVAGDESLIFDVLKLKK